jgi:hypothetical protein
MKFLNTQHMTGSVHDRIAVMEPNPSDFRLSSMVQPYIKLHGSCNWVESSSGGRILIMGGAKAVSIGQSPVLTWYHQQFRNALLQPDARLMLMGYSFSDEHINDAILDALDKSGLKVFIVDPAGIGILDKRDPRAQIPDRPGPLMDIAARLNGFSDRPLSVCLDCRAFLENRSIFCGGDSSPLAPYPFRFDSGASRRSSP